MTDDHLYPARPEMLREGAPIRNDTDDERGHVLTTEPDAFGCIWVAVIDIDCEWYTTRRFPSVLRLDLRDPTARAHAAAVYTGDHGDVTDAVYAAAARNRPDMTLSEAGEMVDVLCRMRRLDSRVTVDEARAALDWAHEVTS